MKKITLAILTLILALPGSLFAQGKYGKDSAECIKYLSYYKEYYKQKAYDDALPNWRKAYAICPATANQTMLIDGTALMRRLINKNTKDPVYRAALIDTLMAIHDARAEAWPKNAVTTRNNKGQDLANYVKDNPARLHREFKSIIEANKGATKASLFLFDLQSAIDLYENGKLGAEDVIACYQRNLGYLEEAKPKSSAETEQIQKVRTDLESLFISSKVASCEDLIALFEPRFQAAPEDLNLVKNIVKMLSITEDCQDNDLYLRAATNMYNLEPSYNSAYFLYKLNSAKGNFDAAVKYLDEAISPTLPPTLSTATNLQPTASRTHASQRLTQPPATPSNSIPPWPASATSSSARSGEP